MRDRRDINFESRQQQLQNTIQFNYNVFFFFFLFSFLLFILFVFTFKWNHFQLCGYSKIFFLISNHFIFMLFRFEFKKLRIFFYFFFSFSSFSLMIILCRLLNFWFRLIFSFHLFFIYVFFILEIVLVFFVATSIYATLTQWKHFYNEREKELSFFFYLLFSAKATTKPLVDIESRLTAKAKYKIQMTFRCWTFLS